MGDETKQSYNIGNLFLLDAGVTQQQLNRALEIQKKHPDRRVGEILVQMGALSCHALKAILDKQKSWRAKGPTTQDVRRMADLAAESGKALTDDMDALIDEIPAKYK